MPTKPRWLLAIPDAIRQLAALDREWLTRRDIEQLFGVSRARAATLMQTFGAEMTRLPGRRVSFGGPKLLRQLRKRTAQRAAFRGEAGTSAHAPGGRAPPGPAHRDPGGGAGRGARGEACPSLPAGVSVEPGTGSRYASVGRRTPSGASSRSPRR